MAEMGDVAGAGLLAHVPTIMLPRAERLELNEGKEISLVPGLERLRREVTRVIETMPDFLKYRPEARFGPYLMMIAALGEGAVAAPGRTTATTRTRSAPARCISGSTGLRGASDDRI